MNKHDGFNYRVTTKVWKYSGKAAWHFVTFPQEIGDKMKDEYGKKRGWGSVPVTVKVGTSVWATSIFPDFKSSTYLLPLKSDIRKRQNIHEGQTVDISARVRGRKIQS